MERKTVLVTGASTGIGRELARVFASRGYDLVLTARSADKLRKLAEECARLYGIDAAVIPADLSRPEAAEDLYRAVITRNSGIDVLVNNAGFSTGGAFAGTDAGDVRDMLQVNIVSLTTLSRLFLTDFILRGKGGLLNVASTAAFMPIPGVAAYAASKAYVLSLSESLADELRGTGVTVTVLCPGPTVTEFAARAGIQSSAVFRLFAMDAARVAEAAYRGFVKGKRVVIPGLLNKFQIRVLAAVTPRRIMSRAAAAMMRPAD